MFFRKSRSLVQHLWAFRTAKIHAICIAAGWTMIMSLSACSTAPAPATFDLTAPAINRAAQKSLSQLAVSEPLSVQALDSDRILVKDSNGSLSFLPAGQWADRLPRLVQTRLIQTFENASRLGKVNRPGDRIIADQQLNTEIREFQIDAATGEAVVSLSAKLINDRTGRVIAARFFTAKIPAASINAATAARHLDEALSQVLTQIVQWVR
jgi:cholesterol transport system auxiliary component